MSFFAIVFALLLEQVRPLSSGNLVHAGVRSWVRWCSRNFDAGRAHHGWVVWGLAVGAAVWLAASREVDELLDEALLSSAQLLAVLNAQALPPPQGDETGLADMAGGPAGVEHFAWQLVDAQDRLRRHLPARSFLASTPRPRARSWGGGRARRGGARLIVAARPRKPAS